MQYVNFDMKICPRNVFSLFYRKNESMERITVGLFFTSFDGAKPL